MLRHNFINCEYIGLKISVFVWNNIPHLQDLEYLLKESILILTNLKTSLFWFSSLLYTAGGLNLIGVLEIKVSVSGSVLLENND